MVTICLLATQSNESPCASSRTQFRQLMPRFIFLASIIASVPPDLLTNEPDNDCANRFYLIIVNLIRESPTLRIDDGKEKPLTLNFIALDFPSVIDIDRTLCWSRSEWKTLPAMYHSIVGRVHIARPLTANFFFSFFIGLLKVSSLFDITRSDVHLAQPIVCIARSCMRFRYFYKITKAKTKKRKKNIASREKEKKQKSFRMFFVAQRAREIREKSQCDFREISKYHRAGPIRYPWRLNINYVAEVFQRVNTT